MRLTYGGKVAQHLGLGLHVSDSGGSKKSVPGWLVTTIGHLCLPLLVDCPGLLPQQSL